MAGSNPFTSAQAPAALPSAPMQLIAPELAAQQISLARQQQIAQMLREKGMADPTGTEMVSGWAVKKSPIEGLSKIASLLAGTYLQNKSDEKNLNLQKAFAEKLRDTAQGGGVLGQVANSGGGGASGSVGISGEQSPGTGIQGNNRYGLGNLMQGIAVEALGGDNAGRTFWADKAATDMEKELRFLGIDPATARQNALAEARVKGTQTLGSGQTAILPNGQMMTGINQEKGIRTEWINGQPVNMPIQGAQGIMADNAAAMKAGENRGTLAPVDALPRNADGTYSPMTMDQIINGNQGGTGQFGTPNALLDSLMQVESSGNPNAINKESGAMGAFQFMPGTVKMLADKGIKFDPMNKDQSRAAADYYIQELVKQNGGDYKKALAQYGGFITKDPSGYIGKVIGGMGGANQRSAGEPFGLKKSIEGNVDLANTRYTALASKNTNAPVMLDALDNVMKYTPGAITGGLADQRELINSLEALIPGFSSAKNTQEKTDLLKKNMNRIVGAGANVPGATDALRNIVEASNPNSKMGAAAVIESSKQLKAIIKMEMANQKVIEPLKLNNDFSGVVKADAEFARYADPKIWELEEMNPQERVRYVKSLSPEKAKALMEKRAKIKELGGL
jgi:hypothetical protein